MMIYYIYIREKNRRNLRNLCKRESNEQKWVNLIIKLSSRLATEFN